MCPSWTCWAATSRRPPTAWLSSGAGEALIQGHDSIENTFCYSEGCSIKQVFVLDLIKVFVLDLNFLAKINEDFK